MSKTSGNESRLRLLYAYRYLMKHTDPEHPAEIKDIIEELKLSHGIETNRNTVSADIEAMIESGMPIEKFFAGKNEYYYDGHCLEGSEIRILIDAVASSKTISAKQSKALKEKLLTFTSKSEAERICGNDYPWTWVKSENEHLYYILDNALSAIEGRNWIRFRYCMNNQDNKRITVNPMRLLWDGEYYYMLGFRYGDTMAEAFRLDKIMDGIEVLRRKARLKKLENDESWYRSLLKMA